jgi:dTDP-glucose 4,6-dehydratase
MKTYLVTGGAGFIGSNYIRNLLSKEKDIFLINLDKLTYSGNLLNLIDISSDKRYFFIKGDILDKELIKNILNGKFSPNGKQIDRIIHFAAESHVDRSISDSSPFVQTNIVGTQMLLDAIKETWSNEAENKKFLHVSTDEVYGSLGSEGLFTEDTPLQPNSPYSASKASSDLLVRAYYETFHLPVVTTRCSNNYGPFQFPEKLIPLVINNIINEKEIPVYGKGINVRDWLYVVDHCEAINCVLEEGKLGEVYNIGGFNEWKNIDIINLLCENLDIALKNKHNSKRLITFVEDRLGHDLRYAINASKIKNELGWTPKHNFNEGIKKTIDWYLSNEDWLSKIGNGEYKKYYYEKYEREK